MIEQDIKILGNIQKILDDTPDATQRILAQKSNVSLGMMNAVLKRCVERGWIVIKNLKMKKVCYCLTQEGLEEISRRSTCYMKRSFEMMKEYAERISSLIGEAKLQGKNKIILIGGSNIQFVIEWACNQNGMEFITDYDMINDKTLIFCGELANEKDITQLLAQGAYSIVEI